MTDRVIKYLAVGTLALMFCMALYVNVFSEPRPPEDSISWEDSGNEQSMIGGYMLYYALETEPTPRHYSDARRVDMGKPSTGGPNFTDSIKAHFPQAKGSMCFRMTAYDTLGNESDFSNEACGWQGMGNPKNLLVK